MSTDGRRPSKRRIEAAQATLAEVSTLERGDLIDDATRDEINHIIYVLDRLMEPS